MKLDILAFAAHPDDAELSCSGTLLKHISMKEKVGIIDLTRGELGTLGNADLRQQETNKASKIMGLDVRENLSIPDGYFMNTPENQMKIIHVIRKYRPEIVLCNAIYDRHPDHAKASNLVSDACFYAGLLKIESKHEGKTQKAWRPKNVYHYIQDRHITPSFIVDISEYFEKKMEVVLAYKSQFYKGEEENNDNPKTPISSKQFLDSIRHRSSELGRTIGVAYGEGFTSERTVGLKNLNQIF